MPKQSLSPKWFAATLLFRSQVGVKKAARSLCEERVVLFESANERLARSAASKYGLAEKLQYDNKYGNRVVWRFVGIEKLEEIDSLTRNRGWEVASRFVRRATPDRSAKSR
jgi:hypothetical protein